MTTAIVWVQDGQSRYATPNLDCGLTLEQIAAQVVPDGTPWVQMALSQAQTECADWIAQQMRSALVLSFAQLMTGLVAEQWITEDEATLWLAGTLPQQVLGLIAELPQEQQFAAKARAIRPSEVLRLDPLVIALGTAVASLSPEEMDQFFITYSGV